MSSVHHVYLSLGSNIDPEIHLPRAVNLLRQYGEVKSTSNAWESHAIGGNAPNFLNAIALLLTSFESVEIKSNVIEPVEKTLGRVRSEDKFAPRTIDIDMVMYDEEAYRLDHWEYAYILLPMAELEPDLTHPITKQKMSAAAQQAQRQTWIIQRKDVLQKT